MNQRTTGAAPATRLPEARERSYTAPHDEQGGAMTGMEAEGLPGSARPPREPLARADRIRIAMLAGLFAMFAAVFGAGAVGFTTLSGQILGLQKQVSDFRTEVHERSVAFGRTCPQRSATSPTASPVSKSGSPVSKR